MAELQQPKEYIKVQQNLNQQAITIQQNVEIKVEQAEQKIPLAQQQQQQQSSSESQILQIKQKKRQISPLQLLYEPEEEQQQIRKSSSVKSQNLSKSILDITKQFSPILQQKQNKIHIKASQIAQKGNSLSKYYVFHIEGKDTHGNFGINRKDKELIALRKILIDRYPGSYIPNFKIKQQIRDQNDKEQVQMKFITNFLVGLSHSPHLYYKEQVQLFLRAQGIDIQQMFNQMPPLQMPDIISRYISHFGEDILKPVEAKVSQKIARFHLKIRKIVNKLEDMPYKMLTLAQSFSKYSKQMKKFGSAMRQYQHFSLAEFTSNNRDMTIFVKDDENQMQKMNNFFSNPYYDLYVLIQTEINDNRSFLEIIIAIGLYALKKQQLDKMIRNIRKQLVDIGQGNKTLKTVTSRKPKQQIQKLLQQKIIKLQLQKQQVNKMEAVVENVMVINTIPTFKLIKKNKYRQILDTWIKTTQKQNPQLQYIWKLINQQASIQLKSLNKQSQ